MHPTLNEENIETSLTERGLITLLRSPHSTVDAFAFYTTVLTQGLMINAIAAVPKPGW